MIPVISIFTLLLTAIAIIVVVMPFYLPKKTVKKTNVRKNTFTTTKTKQTPSYYERKKVPHTDHTLPLPHNSNQSFHRNNEKDVVKDPPLSEAEKNVLYGR